MELIMKKTSRILALLLSLVAVFSLFGCGSKDADGDSSDDNTVYTISWAHSSSTNDRLALATEKMAAELEEASGGRLKIEHYPASQLGAEREIQTPADMVGLKIRTQENDIHMAIVNSLGASATPVAFSELYTALQQGTVDGQENGVALTYSMGFNEVVKYLTYLPHIYDPYIVCMSNAKWNSLPADLQELMQEYATKYCQYEREFNLQNDDEYLQKMVDAGLKVYYPTEEQAQQFVDATAGVEDLIRAKVGDELVDSYKDAVAAAKAE